MALFRKRRGSNDLVVQVYSGHEWLEVKGESQYQDALSSIAGPKVEDGYNLPVDCVLVREPNNEYDSNAIAVYAANPKTGAAVKVGHINRESCLTMAPILDAKNGEGEQVGLVGHIRGGWDRGAGDTGHYGIWLLSDPADFQ
jgi:hypothetical protein